MLKNGRVCGEALASEPNKKNNHALGELSGPSMTTEIADMVSEQFTTALPHIGSICCAAINIKRHAYKMF